MAYKTTYYAYLQFGEGAGGLGARLSALSAVKPSAGA